MIDKIIACLKNQELSNAVELANELSCKDLAKLLDNLDNEYIKDFCREIESELLADTLVLLDADLQEKILKSLRDDELEDVMDELTVEETVDMMKDLPYDVVMRIAEQDEILELLEQKNYVLLKPLLSSMNPIDLASVFEEMEDQDLLRTFRILPKDLAAETFVEMSNELKETLIHKLSNKELKEVMDELFLDDVVDLVEEMPANVVKRIISQNDAETRKYINEILKYPEDSAGSVMTIEYVSLRPKMSVRQALDSIREKAIDKETIYVCYVTDLTKKLIGVVTVKDLLIHKDEEIVEDIMNQNVIYAFTEDDKESVARTISKYGFLALPIVDRENRLVGIVTVDDAIDVLQEESTEDLSMMAAIVPSDKTYLELSPFEIWKQRIPWLLFLLISATFTGLIISAYESKLNAISTLLFACVPMMMGTGGNSGSQASVTVISGLATNELSLRDWLRITWKEFRVSILLGFTLAVACFIKLLLIDKLIFGQPYTYMICFVISLALFFTVVVAKIIGALLPILAKVLKLDPAGVASPFITTIVDAVSLILYCLLAIAIL